MHEESLEIVRTPVQRSPGGLLSAVGSGGMEWGNKKSSWINRNLKPVTHAYSVNFHNPQNHGPENASQES